MSISKRLQDVERKLNRRGVGLGEEPQTKPAFPLIVSRADSPPSDEEIESVVREYYVAHPRYRGTFFMFTRDEDGVGKALSAADLASESRGL